MIDHNFTMAVKAWLDKERYADDAEVMQGAIMMLQLNRNRALFNSVQRQPQKYVEKIRYELRKFLPSRLASLTMDDVVKMENEILPGVDAAISAESSTASSEEKSEDTDTSALPLHKGKRADHDALPPHIQAIWDKNAERWKRIKAERKICESLNAPCDRYEHTKLMKETWYDYKAAFDTYDSYVITAEDIGSNIESAAADPVQLAKDIANAQKYLSKNADELITRRKAAIEEDATSKQIDSYHKLLAEVSRRALILVTNKINITDELKAKLLEGGYDITLIQNYSGNAPTN